MKKNDIVTKNACKECEEKPCIFFKTDEINMGKIDFPIVFDTNVCPVNAIKYNKDIDLITIDNKMCIGCGLCVVRCPYNLLGIESGIVSFNSKKEINSKELNNMYKNIKYKTINNYSINLLSRNVLIQDGIKAGITRTGENSIRMDGIIQYGNNLGVLEIEFGQDALDVPRNLLDDIAVLCSRYKIKKENITGLNICLSLPNKRTDYWNVISDINKVLNIKLKTMTIGSLVYLMWNNKKINLNDLAYLDNSNTNIKKKIEDIMNQNIKFNDDYNSIFNTKK